MLATCRHDQIVKMANNYGLLTVTAARKPEPGKPVHADLLASEPAGIWHKEIRVLRAAIEMFDAGMDRDLVAYRITERLARTPFHLIARPDGNGKIVLRYRPVLLIDAIWQQFAREVAGIIHCAKCPAPNCGRWFLRSGAATTASSAPTRAICAAWRLGCLRPSSVATQNSPIIEAGSPAEAGLVRGGSA